MKTRRVVVLRFLHLLTVLSLVLGSVSPALGLSSRPPFAVQQQTGAPMQAPPSAPLPLADVALPPAPDQQGNDASSATPPNGTAGDAGPAHTVSAITELPATPAGAPPAVATPVTIADDVVIGPEGGSFQSANGRIVVTVPPGAVNGLTRFSYAPVASVPKPQPGLRSAFSLDAVDAQDRVVHTFAAPLTIVYTFTKVTPQPGTLDEPTLSTFDETTKSWLPIAIEVDAQQGRLTARLEHFSLYSENGQSYLLERMSTIRGAQVSLFTGGEAYNYGFLLPPGRAGLAPALGLSYASGRHLPDTGHFSLAGFGWDITGADSIYIPPGDANTFKPTLTLQGVTYSLRQTSDGTWFAKENPFLKIFGVDVSHYTPGTWYVWTSDGVKYTFGTDQNPRAHYWKMCNSPDHGKRYVRLPLTRIDDPNGNTMSYTWQGDQQASQPYDCTIDPVTTSYTRSIRLTSISYNGGTVLAALSYATRDDRPDSYDTATWSLYTDRRLSSVDIQAWDGSTHQTIRTYTLQHSSGPAQAVSQKVLNLDWVEESSGGGALPRLSFGYTDNSFSTLDHFGAMVTMTNGYGGEVAFATSHRNGDSTAHVVSTRTEKPGVSGIPDAVWSYSYGVWDYDASYPELAQGYRNVTVTLPITGTEAHAFHTLQYAGDGLKIDALAGREYLTQVFAGGSELVRTVTTWVSSTASLPLTGYSGMADSAKPRFAYSSQVDAYQNNQFLKRTLQYYDVSRQGGTYQYGNLTEAREYSCIGGTCQSEPVRTSYSQFYPANTANSGGGGVYLVAKPGKQWLYALREGATGAALVSESRIYYDQTSSYTTPPTKGQVWRQQVLATPTTPVGTTYEYYSNGNLYRSIDQSGHETKTYYDPLFQVFVVCVKNHLGQASKTAYYGVPGSTDANCTTSNGPAVTNERFGLVYEQRDPNNAVTTANYDQWGRLTGVWQPGETQGSHGATQVYTYTNYAGTSSPFKVAQSQRSDANGGGSTPAYVDSWTFYDGLGRVIQTQNRAPTATTSFVIDLRPNAFDKVVTQTVPFVQAAAGGTYRSPDWTQPVMRYDYDPLQRTTHITNTDGTVIRTSYKFTQTAVIDELNHMALREVDALGRMIRAKQFTGTYSGAPGWNDTAYALAQYTYDVADRLTKVVAPINATTWITYNMAGWKTAMTDPDMGTWQYGYDGDGLLVVQKDARSPAKVTCFYYDGLHRLVGKYYQDTSMTCPGSPTYAVSYTYDQGTNGIGRRTSMSDPSGGTTWTYDARGRVTDESKAINGTGGGTFHTQWAYDAADRVKTMTYPGGVNNELGETVTTAYNAAGQPYSLTAGGTTYVAETQYAASGAVELRKLGSSGANQVLQDYTYYAWTTANGRGRLSDLRVGTSANPTGLQWLTYVYDAVGNVVQIDDWNTGFPQTQSFGYDALYRLTSAAASGGSYGNYAAETYGYNAGGNLTSKAGRTLSYTDTLHVHAVGAAGSDWFKYDPNGNMTTRKVGANTFTLAYDQESRLTGVTGPTSATFVYDGDGRRVKGTTTPGTTYYIGDYYERDAGGTVRKYYSIGGQRVAMYDGSQAQVRYLLGDHLGSTSVTASTSATKVAELLYKAWGETRYTSGTTPTTRRFTGQQEESTLGLYFYQARWYDPSIGRFAQPDTVMQVAGGISVLSLALGVSYTDPSAVEHLNQTQRRRSLDESHKPQANAPLDGQLLNRYTYVGNSPLARVDSSGHVWWVPAGIIVGGGAGLVAYLVTHPNDRNLRDALVWTGAGALAGATLGAVAGAAAGAIGSSAVAASSAAVPAGSVSINFLANNAQRVQHIMQAKHAWDKLVTLTGNIAKDYEAIQPIIRRVIETGEKTIRDGFVEYRTVINGQEIVVRGRELAEKAFEISNAFVQGK